MTNTLRVNITNLTFRKPHQKQRENLSKNLVVTSIRDAMASEYIPKSKTSCFGGFVGQKLFIKVKLVNGILPRQSKGSLGSHPL